MSRSPRDFEKANRKENVSKFSRLHDLENPSEDGISDELLRKLCERKLKPFFIEQIEKCDKKSFDKFGHPEAIEGAIRFIGKSRIAILSYGEIKDGVRRCEFEMQFDHRIDYEYQDGIAALRIAFEGKPQFIGANCIFIFWFNCPESLLK